MRIFTLQAAWLFSLALGISLSAQAKGEIKSIYVSPTGTDAADGSTELKAVKSLERVQEIVSSNSDNVTEVQVLFAPGTYRGMSVTWKTFPGIWLRFRPSQANKDVIFDGRGGKESVFFRAHPSEPKAKDQAPVPMRLELRNLIIRNYCEGISLRSWNYAIPAPGGAENLIVGNTFEYIGSKYDPVIRSKKRRGACTAALRLQGVEKTIVENNTFRHIINVDKSKTHLGRYGPAHLHAIYVANMARGNMIKNNIFEDFSGDPIRIRDRSDGNHIIGNTFGSVSSGIKPNTIHAVSQWYCNTSIRACVEEHSERKECESSGLRIDDNRIIGNSVSAYTNIAKGRGTCN